uniref:Sodium/potassium-transporting ATPase subunit beta-2 n=1 Tax=Anas zonorhyncha TaxID=75864 RepID=A0A8B9VPV3_9AVES
MWVLLQSVDPHVPKYQDRLATPGMMIRPRAEGLDVTFNVTQSQTWLHYVRALHQFLEPYNDSVQAARNAACTPGRYNEQPDDGVPNYPKRACRFNRSLLGPCAGLGADDDYGYGAGRPCVLLKVNRVRRWGHWEHWEGRMGRVGMRREGLGALGRCKTQWLGRLQCTGRDWEHWESAKPHGWGGSECTGRDWEHWEGAQGNALEVCNALGGTGSTGKGERERLGRAGMR